MNRTTATFFVLGTLASLLPGSFGLAAPGSKPAGKMRDAATHNDLSNKLRLQQQSDPIRNLGPAIGKVDEDPAAKFAGRDLIKDSAIICYRGNLTLVPKRSVLHVPNALKNRLGEQANVKVLRWPDFYNANRGWIRTVEVTRDQAMGLAPMPESTVEALSKSSSVIIATFKSGPISVLPLKEPQEGESAEATTATKELQ